MTQIKHNLEILLDTSKNILLLQGPMSEFFLQFNKWLSKYQKTVYKINFNGGDEYYYPESNPNTFAFTDRIEKFSLFLQDIISKYRIDTIICYADTRPYHVIANQLCVEKNLHFWAIEEGYFRPFFLTIEKYGLNYFSPIPKQAAFFQNSFVHLKQKEYIPPPYISNRFVSSIKKIFWYCFSMERNQNKYPYYQHDREIGLWYLIRHGLIGCMRRLKYRLQDRLLLKKVVHKKMGRFYILPLQVFNDVQVRIHSDYNSVAEFLCEVLQSFAENAPQDLNLMVKHHPVDIYFKDYAKQIKDFIRQNPHCKGRIFYIHDMSLPILLRRGTAMITMNSTSGVSALLHAMPVKVLGRANYDIVGLTDQNSLADFWHNPTAPDGQLFYAYRQYHMNVTQFVGNSHGKVCWPDFPQGEHNE